MIDKNDEVIHVWDFPKNITVRISETFLERLIAERKQRFKSWRRFYDALACKNAFSYFKVCFKPSFKQFIPLEILISACEKLDIPQFELENNIIAYNFARGRSPISKPQLPIEVSPLFSMIVAHGIADGCLSRFKNKDTVFLNYTQYNKNLRKLFLSKVERVFGKIQYKNTYFEERIRIYLPESITRILMEYFNLNRHSFLSDYCEIPKKIFGLGEKHLLACLIGFIIDEGHIDSGQIVIALNNKKHIEQLSGICKLLDYKHTITPRKPKGQNLYMLKDGVVRFWQDYLKLKEKYPEVDMGYKESTLNNFISRLNKDWKSKGKNQTKNKIIDLLREQSESIAGLSKELMISRQGIRFQLKQLKKKGIVMKKGKTRHGGDVYYLIKHIKLPESLKGYSKPIGFTNKRILRLLKEAQLTTMQLVKKVGLHRDSLINQLYYLERENKIKRVGNVKTIAHPTILWKIA